MFAKRIGRRLRKKCRKLFSRGGYTRIVSEQRQTEEVEIYKSVQVIYENINAPLTIRELRNQNDEMDRLRDSSGYATFLLSPSANCRRNHQEEYRGLNQPIDEDINADELLYAEYSTVDRRNYPSHSAAFVRNRPSHHVQNLAAILRDAKLMTDFADNSLEMFALLPDLPLLKVFKYLDGAQILHLHVVCKRWHFLVLSAINQLPKLETDFSLVITENPYAELLSEEDSAESAIVSGFQCHLESMRKVPDSIYSMSNWSVAVGEKTSPKIDLLIGGDDANSELILYRHFKIKRIAFQECTPTIELLNAVGVAFRGKRPSMLRFDHCTLHSKTELSLIQLLRELKEDMKVVVFKSCYNVDAITDNLMKELDQVEQFFVDPNQSGLLSSVTDTALVNIANNFNSRPFHLTLPSSSFTKYGLQGLFRAICFEEYVTVNSNCYQTSPLSIASAVTGNDLHMTWKLNCSMLTISPSSLSSIRDCPEYERNDEVGYVGYYPRAIYHPLYNPYFNNVVGYG